jgi:hypothetical protein
MRRTGRTRQRGQGAALSELEQIRLAHGPEAAARKRELLAALGCGRCASAKALVRFHELLCFLQAFPDDAATLALVDRLLASFSGRADLRRFRRALADTGIAGTVIVLPFYFPTARWLTRRWGPRLTIAWREFGKKDELERLFPLLSLFAETPGLDEVDLGPRGWTKRLAGAKETDAAFLVRRVDALPFDAFWKEFLYESLEMPLRLAPGPTTPSRTLARVAGAAPVFPRGPLVRSRPDIPREVARPPLSLRPVAGAAARRLLDAARASMATRQRDLDIFEYASEADVRLATCGGGLSFAVIGAIPERRLLLEGVYAFLTLKNGVPVGYVLVSALFDSSEIAFNVFESFRGAEAGLIYGRVLSVTRALFGSDTFTIFPYQLGDGNPEAIASGAWWFYRKSGFAPKAKEAIALMRAEEAAARRDPSHRTSPATLRQLAKHNLYAHLGRERDDVIGTVELPDVGLRVTDALAKRFGADRERAARETLREACALLGVRSRDSFSPGERLAFARWAPLVTILPGLARWSVADRRALVPVIRAKGGVRESDFVRLFDAHRPLRRAILALAAGTRT